MRKQKIPGRDINIGNIKNDYKHYCTVGELLEFIKKYNIPNDAKILVQRVEDFYYEENGWGTIKKRGDYYVSEQILIEKLKNKFIPEMSDEIKEMEDNLHTYLDEYTIVWSPVKYNDDDDNNLYLDLHY